MKTFGNNLNPLENKNNEERFDNNGDGFPFMIARVQIRIRCRKIDINTREYGLIELFLISRKQKRLIIISLFVRHFYEIRQIFLIASMNAEAILRIIIMLLLFWLPIFLQLLVLVES